ncbi:hypothetical protein FRC10_008039, partial [Ceratobasidium sp. 414]
MGNDKPTLQLRRLTTEQAVALPPGLRGVEDTRTHTATPQKRKPSQTLSPLKTSQSKKSRGSATVKSSADNSITSALGSVNLQDVEHNDVSPGLPDHETPTTPVAKSFQDTGGANITTPRANKSIAPEDPVDAAQPLSPTTPAAAEAPVSALAALPIHSTPLRVSTSNVDPHSSGPADSK